MTCPRVSFEIFPPNSLTGSFKLWESVRALSNLSPEFISITHGTSSKSSELTSETSKIIKHMHEIDVVPHLTWINSTRSQALENAKTIFKSGITDLLALRGDDRKETNYTNLSDIYSNTLEFITDLRQLTLGKIRVATYPEKHPKSVSPEQDIEWLNKKFTAGADEAITQFFFEADTFLRFRDNCEKSGIKKKIIPGILPIHDFEKVKKWHIFVVQTSRTGYLKLSKKQNVTIAFNYFQRLFAQRCAKPLWKKGLWIFIFTQ